MDTLQKDTLYTYADYLTWDDDRRCELIDGAMYMMPPAPSPIHQRISRGLLYQFYTLLRDKSCQVFAAPFDVRLSAASGDDTVVQPDLLVVCDKTKLDSRGCVGVPDMVIEILSSSTARTDKLLKFNKYQQVGVRECCKEYGNKNSERV